MSYQFSSWCTSDRVVHGPNINTLSRYLVMCELIIFVYVQIYISQDFQLQIFTFSLATSSYSKFNIGILNGSLNNEVNSLERAFMMRIEEQLEKPSCSTLTRLRIQLLAALKPIIKRQSWWKNSRVIQNANILGESSTLIQRSSLPSQKGQNPSQACKKKQNNVRGVGGELVLGKEV